MGGYARSYSTQGQLRLVTGGPPAADRADRCRQRFTASGRPPGSRSPVAANRTPMRRTRGTHAEPLSTRRRLFNVNPLTLARDNPDDDQRELMNGPGHYREAERLRDDAASCGDFSPRAQWCLELAKLHTALAHVAATAQASDGREWI